MTEPTSTQRVAIARARLVAKREPERARRLLMSSGIPWRIAGGLVLDARRKHKEPRP